jgi:hypothetical protein
LQACKVGAPDYWDDTNRRCTTVATLNLLIGVAAAAVAGLPSNHPASDPLVPPLLPAAPWHFQAAGSGRRPT